MSKEIARSAESYDNEALVLELMPALLEPHGFTRVSIVREGGMKFVDADAFDGSHIRFWLKQGWTGQKDYSAIQFGLFDQPGASVLPDSHFIDYVERRVQSAKAKRATHALMVHMLEDEIKNYVALEIGDVSEAYRTQIARWPKKARNTKTPTLWFEDSRRSADSNCVTAVTDLGKRPANPH